MSQISKAIFSILSASTAVTGLVSTRITPEARTQSAVLPCIVYAVNEDETSQALTGAAFRHAKIEILCVGDTAAAASSVHDVARTALQGVAGTYASVVILHCLHEKSLSNYQAPMAGETTGAFLYSAIFSVMYQN